MRDGRIVTMNRLLSCFVILTMLVILSHGTAGLEPGVKETTLHVEKLLAIPGRLEIRTISVSQVGGVLQVDNEAVLEVRSGRVETIINDERQKRVMGDMWLVAPHSTVLRAVYLIR
jgi:hypothetical protein